MTVLVTVSTDVTVTIPPLLQPRFSLQDTEALASKHFQEQDLIGPKSHLVDVSIPKAGSQADVINIKQQRERGKGAGCARDLLDSRDSCNASRENSYNLEEMHLKRVLLNE